MYNHCVNLVIQRKTIKFKMSLLSIEFKKLFNNELIDYTLLVPILIWSSGYEKNIELCQTINKRVFSVKPIILSRQLVLNNTLHHFIQYPTSFMVDKNLLFFYDNISKYFGWTKKELFKNSRVIDIKQMKPIIAHAFAYNNKERKAIGLEAIKNARNKNLQTHTV